MSEPTYGYGRDNPQYQQQYQQQYRQSNMPPTEPPHRQTPQVNLGRLWAGGVGSALVVALVIVVAIMLVRGVLGIAVLSAEGAGTYGTVSTTSYAFAGAAATIVATGLLTLLLMFMPSPLQFFYWICALLTAVAVLLPFTLVADWDAKIATAAINLVAGICLMTLLGSIAKACTTDPRY